MMDFATKPLQIWKESEDVADSSNRKDTFERFNDMRKNSILTDAVLKCQKIEFPVHKSFLASTCEYFYAMFTCGLQESSDNTIELQNIDPKSMDTVLNYLYLGELVFDEGLQNVTNLLDALHFFLLKNAYKQCRFILLSLLNETTYRTIWDLGFKFGDNLILSAVELFICRKAATIHQTEEIVALNASQISRLVECFVNMISYHYLEVIEIILKWVDYDQPNRFVHLPAFFSKLNLRKLSPEIVQNLLKHPLINGHKEVFDLISAVPLRTPRFVSDEMKCINQNLNLQVIVLGKNKNESVCEMLFYYPHWEEWSSIKLPLIDVSGNDPIYNVEDPSTFFGFEDAAYDHKSGRLVAVSKNSSNCIVDVNGHLINLEDSQSHIKTKFKWTDYEKSKIIIDNDKTYIIGFLNVFDESFSDGNYTSICDTYVVNLVFKEMDHNLYSPLWKTITRVEESGVSSSSVVASFTKNENDLCVVLIDSDGRNGPFLLHWFKIELNSSSLYQCHCEDIDEEELCYYNRELPFDFSEKNFLFANISMKIIFKHKANVGGYIFDFNEKKFFDIQPMENEPCNIVALTNWNETLWALDTCNQVHVCYFEMNKWEKIGDVPVCETFIPRKIFIGEN